MLARIAAVGFMAHEALKMADPKDRMGSWMDKNVPGAAAIDDFFGRHGGWGRTYQQQQEAAPDLYQRQSYRPTGGADMRPIQINSTVMLDGRAVGRAVTTHQGRELAGPSRGTTGFDLRESPMQPGAGAVAI